MKAIAAMSLNRVIARKGKIPWHLPDDFKWFRSVTMGGVVVMGRKTFESLGKPLPGRVNVVVTRASLDVAGVEVVPEFASFDPQKYDRDVFIIGGAQIYGQALSRCTDLFLTVVRREVAGDTFFPEFEQDFVFVSLPLQHAEFEVRHYRNRRLLIA